MKKVLMIMAVTKMIMIKITNEMGTLLLIQNDEENEEDIYDDGDCGDKGDDDDYAID
jgi:hypothetical protein